MEKKYVKEMTNLVDAERGVDCVNLCIGAADRDGFLWIVNNLTQFKQESINCYNEILLSITTRMKIKLFFIIKDEEDIDFLSNERHSEIFENCKEIKTNESTKIYLNDNLRYAYVKIDNLSVDDTSIYNRGIFVFLKDETEIHDYIMQNNKEDIFNRFYFNGCLITKFRDLWTDGNALVFYSINKNILNEILDIAKDKQFVLHQ